MTTPHPPQQPQPEASRGEPLRPEEREGRGMRILIGLAIIIALAYLGYRMFFVNAHKK